MTVISKSNEGSVTKRQRESERPHEKTTGLNGRRTEKGDTRSSPRQRRHRVNATVELVRDGIPNCTIVRALNLSWSGAMLRVPNTGIAKKESVVLRFPGAHKDSILTRAEVVWGRLADDRQRLLGVRFTKLRVSDEAQLRQVLSKLAAPPSETGHDARMEGQIDIYFDDREAMLVAVGQIHNGFLETMVNGPIRTTEPVPVTIAGLGDLPTLHLRTHVLSCKTSDAGDAAETSGAHGVTLALDHPIEDLRSVTNPLILSLRGYDDITALKIACTTILERGCDLRREDTVASPPLGVGIRPQTAHLGLTSEAPALHGVPHSSLGHGRCKIT
jgi:hypothetical protein